MKRLLFLTLCVALIAAAAIMTGFIRLRPQAPPPVRWNTTFTEAFDTPLEVKEASFPTRSPSPEWWVGSGAGMTVRDGVGGTWAGEAPLGYFRWRYAERNPVDTDEGLHPQNIFRLVTQRQWSGHSRQQAYFRILKYNLSDSPQRYDPNGLLLFNRYADENNLYYAGIRVDGHAVIKKKSGGSYYTLAEKVVFPGTYDRDDEPILLPQRKWIGLRAEVIDEADGSVTVWLYIDKDRDGDWEPLLKGTDAGVGGRPFREGRGGIRTDFMDVEFDDYSMSTVR